MRPVRLFVFAAGALLALEGASASPLVPTPSTCAVELSASDAAGNTVFQTVAYALDRPGLVLAPLSPTARLRPRWERLRTFSDPALSGSGSGRAGVEVTEVLLQDPSRDLVLLRAPGLEACASEGDATADDASVGAEPASTRRIEGEPLIGIRDRDGYRPRVFQARVDKMIVVGAGPGLLRIRIPDGGGAASGFLLDRQHHLIASILPPPPGGDRLFACAVPIDRRELDLAAAGPGRPVSDALLHAADDVSRTPAGLWAQALLLTRDDQADQALRLLDEVSRLAGDTDALLLERGVRRFRIGRNDAAIEDFAGAARLNPGLHLAQFNLGVALGASGRYTQAIDAFRRALEIDPRHAQTRYQLALALMAANQPERAREEYRRLEPLDAALASDLRAALAF